MTPLLAPIPPGTRVGLSDDEARTAPGAPRGDRLERETGRLLSRMEELGNLLYAEGRRAVLVVLQSRDAGGKDGTIRKVFGALNPQGCRVRAFGVPAGDETKHDFLWRFHREVPPYGHVGVFNRSYYEDVLAARVRNLVPEGTWAKRFAQINAWERILSENEITILKFFLHVSREEQKSRLLKRLRDPAKNWKFDPGDLDDRALWDEYTQAYQEVFFRCSTPHAPWYVVPADKKPLRNLLVAQVVVDALEQLAPVPRVAAPDIDGYADRLT